MDSVSCSTISKGPSSSITCRVFQFLCRERKAAAKDAAQKKASKDAEDAYWRSAGEGAKTKVMQRPQQLHAQQLITTCIVIHLV
jgi:hypothetical protein